MRVGWKASAYPMRACAPQCRAEATIASGSTMADRSTCEAWAARAASLPLSCAVTSTKTVGVKVSVEGLW